MESLSDYILALITSFSPCLLGYWMVKTTIRQYLKCKSQTEGIITHYTTCRYENRHQMSETGYQFHYTYTVNNKVYTAVCSSVEVSCKHEIGETIVVKYDPANPSYNYVEIPNHKLIMLLGGLFLILIGGGASAMILIAMDKV